VRVGQRARSAAMCVASAPYGSAAKRVTAISQGLRTLKRHKNISERLSVAIRGVHSAAALRDVPCCRQLEVRRADEDECRSVRHAAVKIWVPVVARYSAASAGAGMFRPGKRA